ncbi:MAG: hypothetical protein J0I70_05490, partial [Microbacterium sp.]|nr:hypothetical protein [Microbacterium sp.]
WNRLVSHCSRQLGAGQLGYPQLTGLPALRERIAAYLALSRGIACQPALLLLDEPTAQLDIQTAREVTRGISALRAAETIVVVATHDVATQEACTDRLDLRDFQGSGPYAGRARS